MNLDELRQAMASDATKEKVHYVRVPKNHIIIDFDIPMDKFKKENRAAKKLMEESNNA